MEEEVIKPQIFKSSKNGITPEIANDIIEFISSSPVTAVKV